MEAAGLGPLKHRQEVVVLGQAVLGLVVEPVVAGYDPIAVGPDDGDQVDAPDDPLVLARPVAADQVDLLGVVLIERRVVEDQQAALRWTMGRASSRGWRDRARGDGGVG